MELAKSLEYCRSYAFNGMEYPYIISKLLGAEKHNAVTACLGSFREIANQIHELLRTKSLNEINIQEINENLSTWLRHLTDCKAGKSCDHQLGPAVKEMFSKFDIPIFVWNNFADAMKYHLSHSSIPDFESFQKYSKLSFGPAVYCFLYILCSEKNNQADTKYSPVINPEFISDDLATLFFIVHTLVDFQNDLTSTVDGFVYIPDKLLNKHSFDRQRLLNIKDDEQSHKDFRALVDDLYHTGHEYELICREKLIILRGEIKKEDWFVLDMLVNIFANFLHRIWEFPHSLFNGGYPIDQSMVFLNALKLQKDFGLRFKSNVAELLFASNPVKS